MALKNHSLLVTLLGLLFTFNLAVSSEFVPVYLWQTGKSGESVPALPKLTRDNFGELIHNRLDENTILVTFAEPNLSPEDFNAVTQSGDRVFNSLSNIKEDVSTIYLPQVQTPVKAVFKFFGENITTIAAEDFKSEDIESSAIIIDLNDVQDDEDRNHMLARHDKIIVDIYDQLLKKYKNVVALFTGKQASWVAPQEVLSRKVREIPANAWIIKDAEFKFLAYATEAPIFQNYVLNELTTVKTEVQGTTLIATISGGNFVLTFKFGFDPTLDVGTYWYFESVDLVQGTTYSFKVPNKVYPPRRFSYQCTSQVFETTNGDRLSFKNLQIQPFQEAQDVNNFKFGDAYFCVGFTSPAIWSGIFITFLLATIMAIGLMMMMDMKTMDRFDDPKGKTIVVNVSE
ncbi:V-type proton ATPase subunit S1 [Onthophagus taurus]|uniref:V-type proton ATPase subunit S1 n=1 Tax=Onthophagus taurus TaxID=166361 RepID=UPI0039BE0928